MKEQSKNFKKCSDMRKGEENKDGSEASDKGHHFLSLT